MVCVEYVWVCVECVYGVCACVYVHVYAVCVCVGGCGVYVRLCRYGVGGMYGVCVCMWVYVVCMCRRVCVCTCVHGMHVHLSRCVVCVLMAHGMYHMTRESSGSGSCDPVGVGGGGAFSSNGPQARRVLALQSKAAMCESSEQRPRNPQDPWPQHRLRMEAPGILQIGRLRPRKGGPARGSASPQPSLLQQLAGAERHVSWTCERRPGGGMTSRKSGCHMAEGLTFSDALTH